ncbi:uncharacterized protein LOC105432353 [Pogonomyrmex barbatus]|uniref:Uncharacterized protein LOC105432353 n=1 Tax=Pogonomyrmex barbatus TaxID=144034 RepID=A0A6I9WSU2_9HYME|nr:uncharacterized protein LOC105432353 [Pogonomyrmex barbatus]
MATQRDPDDDLASLSYIKRNIIATCNICKKKFYGPCRKELMKTHISNHRIGDKITFLNYREIFLRRYFTQEAFVEKCKICNARINLARPRLAKELHLRRHQNIISKIREEIKQSWVSQHFMFDKDLADYKTKCINCGCVFVIFLGTDGLEEHLPEEIASISYQQANTDSQIPKNKREHDDSTDDE